LIFGAAAVAIAAIFMGRADVVGAAIGAALAVVNWLVYSWVGRRVVAVGTKPRVLVFLAVKTAALLAIIWFVATSGIASPKGLLLGVSSLVLGILVRSSVQVIAEGDAALREER